MMIRKRWIYCKNIKRSIRRFRNDLRTFIKFWCEDFFCMHFGPKTLASVFENIVDLIRQFVGSLYKSTNIDFYIIYRGSAAPLTIRAPPYHIYTIFFKAVAINHISYSR